jgi:hypothetical protein
VEGETAMQCDYQKVFQLIDSGDWHGAHRMVQVHYDRLSCLIHGYLHWDEGDLGNSAYWYHRAGEEVPKTTLPEELKRLKQMA